MPIEFIGMIHLRPGNDFPLERARAAADSAPSDVLIDKYYVRRFAQVHEASGFDKVLIGTSSRSPEGAQVAAYAANYTDRITFLVSHRPGFRAPTVVSREFATLHHFADGRVAIHVITGGSDLELRKDGDYVGHDDRYARTDEYLTILRKAWTANEPFDFHGKYYRLEGYQSPVRPFKHLPFYFGGSSEAAYRVGAKHADVYALWGEPLAETKQQIASIAAAAAAHGRVTPPSISVSFRPILGATDALAWERARKILAETEARDPQRSGRFGVVGSERQRSVGSQRLQAAAAKADRHDRALFTGITKALGGGGNSTALVGTAETVAQALLDYYDIGVRTFLIRGFDPYQDAFDYGRELIPRVRELVREREEKAASAKVA